MIGRRDTAIAVSCFLVFVPVLVRLFLLQHSVLQIVPIGFLLLCIWSRREFFHKGIRSCASASEQEILQARRIPAAAFLLGLAVPLASVTSSGLLLLLAMIFSVVSLAASVAFSNSARSPEGFGGLPVWAAWLVAFLFLQGGSVFVRDFDPETISALFRGIDGPGTAGLANVVDWLTVSPPHYLVLLESVSRIFVLLVLYSHFSRETAERAAFFRGFLTAVWVPAAIAALSRMNMIPFAVPSQTPFWDMQHRFAGTYADPNAFGIMTALSLPLFLQRLSESGGAKRLLWILLGIFCLWGGLFSGSRSFLLGVGISGAFVLYRISRKCFTLSMIVCALALAAWNLTVFLAPDVAARLSSSLPVAAERLLDTLSLATLSRALFSRALFYEVAFRMWHENPVLGVGPGSFRAFVPLYTVLSGTDVGMWVDNANNWYLQILAETGLVGASAWFMACRNLSMREAPAVLRLFVPLLLVLLLLGPHLEFDEVAVFSSAMLASVLVPRVSEKGSGSVSVNLGILGAGCACLIVAHAWFSDHGFHGFEREGNSFYRWTGRTADGRMYCDGDGTARLGIRPVIPAGYSVPMIVRVRTGSDPAIEKRFHATPAHPVVLDLRCMEGADLLQYSVEVVNPWTPRKFGFGSDSRLLGVRVFAIPPAAGKQEAG